MERVSNPKATPHLPAFLRIAFPFSILRFIPLAKRQTSYSCILVRFAAGSGEWYIRLRRTLMNNKTPHNSTFGENLSPAQEKAIRLYRN